jgi:hypothetical protein
MATFRFFIVPLLAIVLLSSSGLIPTMNAQGYPKIISFKVDGAPNYDAPGNESFWRAMDWTNISLAASVSPGGGHTPEVSIKSANDGFNIYVLLKWKDSVGPSFGAENETFTAPNGTLIPLSQETTMNVTQLFYNSTYYYPDRVAILWFLVGSREQSPAMELGSNGAITGGAAEIWHWQSVPTDNNPNDTSFPGGYTDPTGRVIYPNNNMSFAEDDYTNKTGFFVTAGSFGAAAPNLDPYADPFIVHVGNAFSDSNKTWSIEMVRSLTTSDPQFQVQLKTGATYYAAFAVWNGRLGESAHIKSVSQWYTITINDSPPPYMLTTPTSQIPEITPMLAAAVGLGLLIVGIIIGVVVRPKNKG